MLDQLQARTVQQPPAWPYPSPVHYRRWIVSNAGGGITVVSEPGRGATFDVYLPRVEETLTASASPAPVVSGEEIPANATILVVEDETSVRTLVTRVLQRHGYGVLHVAGPLEALELSHEQLSAVDLVLSDVVMPHMSGREFVSSLKQLRPDLTVMFMSGYTHDEVVRRGVADEDFLFIEKPFSPAELVLKVQEALRPA